MEMIFRPAVRESVSLLVGLTGGTGSGKSYSAMRLASGIVGKGNRFAVIDTENRRALHYADMFNFDHCQLDPPFRPERYIEAIQEADKLGYKAIVVDSMSHVWAGDGGVLDWQDEELQRMSKGDWKKAEQCRMASWIKPKVAHKKMVSKLLIAKAHVILCYRAEEKIEMVKNQKGKTEIIKKETLTGLDGWVPVCEKNLPYEHTCSFLFTADNPGVPKPIKLQEQHKHLFDLNSKITEKAGEQIMVWADGAKEELTPDHKLWDGAKKAYIRDGNLDKVLLTMTISKENEKLLTQKVNKKEDVKQPEFDGDYELYFKIAEEDHPEELVKAKKINGLDGTKIAEMADILLENLKKTYDKLVG